MKHVLGVVHSARSYYLRGQKAFSSSGALLATSTNSPNSFGETVSTLASHDLETMTKTQSLVMPDFATTCFAVSPDSKQLVVGNVVDDDMGGIRFFQAGDLSIQRDLDTPL